MKDFQNHRPGSAVSSHRSRFLLLIAVSACLLFAVVLTAASGKLPLSASAASSAHASTDSSATLSGYPIKVFFSKFPDSVNTNPSAVFAVDRVSPSLAVGTFSIQLLIAGPTLTERSNGYFSELSSILTGPSNCSAPFPTGGPDFKLTLNKRGPKDEQGTATVQFCRATNSPGIGADARIQAEITTTLEQFPNIKRVVILTYDGHCFGDESGKDLCLS